MRINEYPVTDTVTDDDYIIVDSETSGSRKYKAKGLGGGEGEATNFATIDPDGDTLDKIYSANSQSTVANGPKYFSFDDFENVSHNDNDVIRYGDVIRMLPFIGGKSFPTSISDTARMKEIKTLNTYRGTGEPTYSTTYIEPYILKTGTGQTIRYRTNVASPGILPTASTASSNNANIVSSYTSGDYCLHQFGGDLGGTGVGSYISSSYKEDFFKYIVTPDAYLNGLGNEIFLIDHPNYHNRKMSDNSVSRYVNYIGTEVNNNDPRIYYDPSISKNGVDICVDLTGRVYDDIQKYGLENITFKTPDIRLRSRMLMWSYTNAVIDIPSMFFSPGSFTKISPPNSYTGSVLKPAIKILDYPGDEFVYDKVYKHTDFVGVSEYDFYNKGGSNDFVELFETRYIPAFNIYDDGFFTYANAFPDSGKSFTIKRMGVVGGIYGICLYLFKNKKWSVLRVIPRVHYIQDSINIHRSVLTDTTTRMASNASSGKGSRVVRSINASESVYVFIRSYSGQMNVRPFEYQYTPTVRLS